METNNKLREAVKKLLDVLYDMGVDENTLAIAIESPNCQMKSEYTLSVIKEARAALAEPVRNYEVGTVKEQAERFDAFCQSNMKFYRDMFGHDDEGRLDGWDCREDCPVGGMIDSGTAAPDHCQLAWAQMPYVEKEWCDK